MRFTRWLLHEIDNRSGATSSCRPQIRRRPEKLPKGYPKKKSLLHIALGFENTVAGEKGGQMKNMTLLSTSEAP
jgi:hypothetical protein